MVVDVVVVVVVVGVSACAFIRVSASRKVMAKARRRVGRLDREKGIVSDMYTGPSSCEWKLLGERGGNDARPSHAPALRPSPCRSGAPPRRSAPGTGGSAGPPPRGAPRTPRTRRRGRTRRARRPEAAPCKRGRCPSRIGGWPRTRFSASRRRCSDLPREGSNQPRKSGPAHRYCFDS